MSIHKAHRAEFDITRLVDLAARPTNDQRLARYVAVRTARRAHLAELMAEDWAARRATWWEDFMAVGR